MPFLALHKINANPSHTNHICGLDQSAASTLCGRSPANSGKNCFMALSGAGVRRAWWSGGKSRNETRVAKNKFNSGFIVLAVQLRSGDGGALFCWYPILGLRTWVALFWCSHSGKNRATRFRWHMRPFAFVIPMPFQNNKFGAEHPIAVMTDMDFLTEGEKQDFLSSKRRQFEWK